ncbi:MAG: class I SAM-dependent rRNA methyltransferase [Oligoflexus sp.]
MTAKSSQKRLYLKPGREKSVINRHPWIFSGAVARVEGQAKAGETIAIYSAKNQPLGRASYHPQSQIVARIYSLDPEQEMDHEWLRAKIRASIDRRKDIQIDESTNMVRLIAHEADGIPGLIVDRYGSWLSLQILNSAMEARRDLIVDILQELLAPDGIIERSDEVIRKKEGLQPIKQILRGKWAEGHLHEGMENHHRYQVDLWNGHKTGFYIDQRDNRQIVSQLSAGRRVLNNFSYTGGFSVAALAGGATELISVDTSHDALDLAASNVRLNGLDDGRHQICKADVFQNLRQRETNGECFDMIILDPPKFASSQRNIQTACRGYKDLNRLALKLLRPGGLLVSFSCSGLISQDLLQKVVFSASIEADCELELQRFLKQASDHPIVFHLPESYYLKGFVCEKR